MCHSASLVFVVTCGMHAVVAHSHTPHVRGNAEVGGGGGVTLAVFSVLSGMKLNRTCIHGY